VTIKQDWTVALRSGDYAQGHYQLRDINNRYDAAGVLCDLAVKAGIIDEPEFRGPVEEGVFRQFYGYIYDGMASWVPESVVEWSGMGRHQINRVAMMGDNKKTFADLADYIDKEF